MIAVVLALVAQSSSATSGDNQPDISRPISTYVDCVADRTAEDRRTKTADAALIRVIHLNARMACANARRVAMAEVERILLTHPSHQDATARATLVNSIFVGIDHRFDGIDAALQELEVIRNNFEKRN